MKPPRFLSLAEKLVLLKLINQLDIQTRNNISCDIECATVTEENSDGSILRFHISGYNRPKYEGQREYPVEGRVFDTDGELLTVCIYADQNNRLYELELIRYADGDVMKPDWNTFEIYKTSLR